MSRPEVFTVCCDYPGCDEVLSGFRGPVRFEDHSKAQLAMRERDWYYDAQADLCPAHFPRPERHKCLRCTGRGFVVYSGASMRCPRCGGEGYE